jgi:hypothetical protein
MNMRFKGTAATLPGIGIAVLPKAVCPVCSPAYAAILSSLGLPFLATATYLFPLTVMFVGVAFGSLYFRAARRRGLAPFCLGALAAASLLAGKFWIDSTAAVFIGMALLIAASIWNAVPKQSVCPACEAGPFQMRSPTHHGNSYAHDRGLQRGLCDVQGNHRSREEGCGSERGGPRS